MGKGFSKCIFGYAIVSFFILYSGLVGLGGSAMAQGGAGGGAPSLTTAIERVAKQNIPAVVHVEVTEQQEVANPLAPFENEPFFHYFFNVPKNMPKKFQRQVLGLGSGMIMDTEGHILTNNHVVSGATKIKVVLADGREFTGSEVKTIGTDPKTDLAVIQIPGSANLPHVTFGDSDKMEVGQWVVAIGQPRGLSQTVTQGIISAMHRRGISNPSSYEDFLQTDAAINPGNSGGPLINLAGDVIGINAAIVSESGGFEGIGFAIPSNMATRISKQLIASGKVVRGWLGVSIQDLTPDLAKSFGLSSTKGVLVADVLKDSPGEKAGLKRGDVVLSYQGKPVPDAASLRDEVAASPIGENATITILRSGEKKDVTVKIGSQHEETEVMESYLKQHLGITVRPMTAKDAERYGVSAEQGVVITSVDPKGVFGKAGFEVGDLILEVGGQPIDSATTLNGLFEALPPHHPVTVLAVDHKTKEAGYVQVQMP